MRLDSRWKSYVDSLIQFTILGLLGYAVGATLGAVLGHAIGDTLGAALGRVVQIDVPKNLLLYSYFVDHPLAPS